MIRTKEIARIIPCFFLVAQATNSVIFVLVVYESNKESLQGMSDLQAQVRYNSIAENEDDAVEEILDTYTYIVPHPEATFVQTFQVMLTR